MKASAERNQQTVGDVELRVAALDGLGAIDVHLNSRQIEELVDAQIHGAGHGAKLAEQIGGEGVVGGQVRTGNLDVDGRRQAEVQNLADDVGRQEVEGHAGKFARQLAAQLVDVEVRGPVAGLERDQDIGVHGADRRRIAVGHVDGAVRQPDVVDDAGQLGRREWLRAWRSRSGRPGARSLRCGCRFWRGNAD